MYILELKPVLYHMCVNENVFYRVKNMVTHNGFFEKVLEIYVHVRLILV